MLPGRQGMAPWCAKVTPQTTTIPWNLKTKNQAHESENQNQFKTCNILQTQNHKTKKSALSKSTSTKTTIAIKIKNKIDGQIAFTITATTWLLRTLARLDRRDRHTGHGREFNLSSTAWTQEPADGLPTPLACAPRASKSSARSQASYLTICSSM